MKSFMKYGWMGLCVLLLVSCKTTKSGLASGSLSGAEGAAYVSGVIDNALTCESLTGKMKFVLDTNGKQLSLGGNLRMKRNDVIQLSLVAFGLMEAARIEFTADEVLVVDRVNKQYVRASYADLDFLNEAGVNFYTLQALFWNELFLPGGTPVTAEESKAFRVTKETDQAVLTGKSTRLFSTRFFTSLTDGLLRKTEISAVPPYQLNWNYEEFTPVETKPFPGKMRIDLEGLKRPVTVTLRLSNVRADADWETRTKVSGRYRQVTTDELLKLLLKL